VAKQGSLVDKQELAMWGIVGDGGPKISEAASYHVSISARIMLLVKIRMS